jgi:hypothetical protein
MVSVYFTRHQKLLIRRRGCAYLVKKTVRSMSRPLVDAPHIGRGRSSKTILG